MSNNFIGSKIAIITKTQCRYIGTIIGIDPTTSSILLGTVTCFGTENRPGNFLTNQIAGTIVPLMQFANSDIEDLKIVDDEYIANEIAQKQAPRATNVAPSSTTFPQPSIHDDPAIVSAVLSSSKQEQRANSSLSNQLMTAFDQMNLANENSKTEGFLLPSEPVEIQSSWPTVIGSTKVESNEKKPMKPTVETTQNNQSRFFDQFSLKSNETFQSNRDQAHPPSSFSNQPTQRSSYHQSEHYGARSSNGNQQNASRHFYNNHHRSGYGLLNSNRRPNGNRETFQTNVDEISDDFDFESNNRNFQKLTSEDGHEQVETDRTSQNKAVYREQAPGQDFQPIYDKKKSFFDNSTNPNDAEPLKSNRTLNKETFGADGFARRPKNRVQQNYNYRRPNNNQYRQQPAYDEYFYRPSNNANGNSARR